VNRADTIWQIVPRAPGGREGVGDYAQILAMRLEQMHGYATVFVTGATIAEARSSEPPAAIVLHYVNYGYHSRGVPFRLLQQLGRLQDQSSAKLITIFHELSASGTWRQSAFWLRPLQRRIARAIARRSAACLVSSPAVGEQLHHLSPASRIVVRPVISNFGEPRLSSAQISNRDFARWIICGGSELIQRSLSSFLQIAPLIPAPHSPRELFVVGGTENAEIRAQLDGLQNVRTYYYPNVDSNVAAEILSTCVFAWIDYFHQPHVPMATILKSSVFAAFCAHGVIPVFPQGGSAIELRGDTLPGPFFVSQSRHNLPAESERARVAQALYEWYGRNASSQCLATIVQAAIERPA
jgi:hypothetical protein